MRQTSKRQPSLPLLNRFEIMPHKPFYNRFIAKLQSSSALNNKRCSEDPLSFPKLLTLTEDPSMPALTTKRSASPYLTLSTHFKKLNVGITVQEIGLESLPQQWKPSQKSVRTRKTGAFINKLKPIARPLCNLSPFVKSFPLTNA